MRTIWKYPVPITDRFSHEIPKDYGFLDVQMQGDTPMLWVEVESESPKERVDFALVGTGRACPDPDEGAYWYLGTFQMHGGALVWHLFYRNPWGG